MRVLNLFTGGGGGALAELLLGWESVGYLEWEDYCCERLADRISDGSIPDAPIFHCDIRDFVRSGYAELYRGVADVVAGGPPCQPFSCTGKRTGSDDARNMWPAFLDVVRVVRPRLVVVENVPALMRGKSAPYFGTILSDLASVGYRVGWDVVSAADAGAPHRRERLWVVAHARCGSLRPDR